MSTIKEIKRTNTDDDYIFASKALLMPHLNQLITQGADNNEYYKVLNSILYLLNNTDTFNSYDKSEIFFSLTQLMTTNNVGLKRYLMILLKQIDTDSESIIITQQVLNQINSDQQYLKSASLRLLLSKVSEDMLPQCTLIVSSLLSADLPSNVITSAIIYFNKFYPVNTPTFNLYKEKFKTLIKETNRLEKDDACSKAIKYYYRNTEDAELIRSLLPVAKSRNLTMKTLLSIAKTMVFDSRNAVDIELIYKIVKAASNSKFGCLKFKGAKINLDILKVKGLKKDMQLDLQKQIQESISLFCNGDNIHMSCGITLLNSLLDNIIRGGYTAIVENKFNLFFATNSSISQVINTINLNSRNTVKTQSINENGVLEFNNNSNSYEAEFEVISIIVKYNFLFDVDDALHILKEIKEYVDSCGGKYVQKLLNEIIGLKEYFWKLNKTGFDFVVKYLTYLLETISKKTKKTGKESASNNSPEIISCVSTLTALIRERTDIDLFNVFEKMLGLNNKMVTNIILDNMCAILIGENTKFGKENELKEKILRWLAETYLLKEDSFKEKIFMKLKGVLTKKPYNSTDKIYSLIEDFIRSIESSVVGTTIVSKIAKPLKFEKDELPLDLEALVKELETCKGDEIYELDINKFCYEIQKPKQRPQEDYTARSTKLSDSIQGVSLKEAKPKLIEDSLLLQRTRKRDDISLNPDLIPICSIDGRIELSGSSVKMRYNISVITNKLMFLKVYIENKLDEEIISNIQMDLTKLKNMKLLDQEISDEEFEKLEMASNSTISNVYLLGLENNHLKLDLEFSLNLSFKTKDVLTPDSIVLDESYVSKKICPQNIFLFKPTDSLAHSSEIIKREEERYEIEEQTDDVFKHEVKKRFKINKDFDIGILFNKFNTIFKELGSKHESLETRKKYYTEDFMGNKYLVDVLVKDIDDDYNKVELNVRSNDNIELNDFFIILDILNI